MSNASLIDFHHDASLKSILEDDSISSASKAYIRFCSGKGARRWLVVRPCICSFRIAHSTFTSMLRFHFGLIQPSTSSFFTCECGHMLDPSNTHLVHCPFGGQWIATHDPIWNVMYAFTWKNEHIVWKERWYALTSNVSLWINLYMTQTD
jgi:hypothetical protein